MYPPLQSLASPRFAVPFGVAVLGGLLAVLAGTVLARTGLALPWAAVAGVLGVLSVAGFALALGVALLGGIRDQGGRN